MFNPNAPHPGRPSHSLNTPVPILIDSDEEISDAENDSDNDSESENDSMQVDEYPQLQTHDMGNYSITSPHSHPSSFPIRSILFPRRNELIDK